MRIDMYLYAADQHYHFCFAAAMNYHENEYGWLLKVRDNDKCERMYQDGKLLLDPAKISLTNNELFVSKTSNICHPKKISAKELSKKVISHLNDLTIYTGAGISTNVGIWDMIQLRHHLSLDDSDELMSRVIRKDEILLNTLREFANQLYNTHPSREFFELAELQREFDIMVVTENRDQVQQKAGITVYNRDMISGVPFLFSKKYMLIIGVSADHSNYINRYRNSHPEKEIFVLNEFEIPHYVKEQDYLCNENAAVFIDELYRMTSVMKGRR